MTIRIRHSAPKKPRLSSQLGLCYAAGMLDGEGCIYIMKKRDSNSSCGFYYRLRVIVSQNHLHTLTDFQDLLRISGLLYQLRRGIDQHRDGFQLIFEGDKAAALLEALLPYLLRKAPEAAVALEYQRTCEVKRRVGRAGCPASIWALRESYYAKLRLMK